MNAKEPPHKPPESGPATAGVGRRALLHGAAVAGAATLGGLGSLARTGPALAGPAGFPTYQYIGMPFDKSTLDYNPTNEFIFPCVRGVYTQLSNPLGRYYLYYAPHELPGGICLAYGNSLGGPFTEYPNNPIIKAVWSPHYAVSHVSSPHAMWHPNGKMYLYFHGENDTTRLATSTDGIHFTYDKAVLTAANIPGTSATSYARVFPHTIASKGSSYVMVFMGGPVSSLKIFWGWSADARNWQFDPTPLISPAADGLINISSPHVLWRNGTTYVAYHGNNGRIYLTEVGNDFSKEVHLGVFHQPMSGAPDNGRVAAPAFGTDNGVSYMFYESGQRLVSTIAVARAV